MIETAMESFKDIGTAMTLGVMDRTAGRGRTGKL
jgi:hypothetical protein